MLPAVKAKQGHIERQVCLVACAPEGEQVIKCNVTYYVKDTTRDI